MLLEVATKSDLPDLMPPALCYVRDEGRWYLRHADSWTDGSNTFFNTTDEAVETSALTEGSVESRLQAFHQLFWGGVPRVSHDRGDISVTPGDIFLHHEEGVSRAVAEGTPGMHIQRKRTKLSVYDYHNEPIAWIVTSGAEYGADTIRLEAGPESLPRFTQNEDGARTTFTNNGVQIPTSGPWALEKCAYLRVPMVKARVPVGGVIPSGGAFPAGAVAKVKTDIRLATPITAVGFVDLQPDDRFFPDPRPAGFGGVVVGLYGAANTDSFEVLITDSGEEGLKEGAPVGGTMVTLEREHPYVHNGLYGLKIGDYIRFNNHAQMYKVTGLPNAYYYNPSRVQFSPGLVQSVSSGERMIRYSSALEGYGIEFNGPQYLAVDQVRGNTLVLAGQLPCNLRAGRYPVYADSGITTATFAFNDPSFAVWSQEMRKNWAPNAALAKLAQAQKRLEANYYWAYNRAFTEYLPPRRQNLPLSNWLWDDLKQYGATFAEINTELLRRTGYIVTTGETLDYSKLNHIQILDYRSSRA